MKGITGIAARIDDRKSKLAALPPLVSAWAERESANILRRGKPLAFWQMADAAEVGVRNAAKVRILFVDAMPWPANSLLDPETQGLGLGYGIMILRSRAGVRRILRHALHHVAQYEKVGSLDAFLASYFDSPISFYRAN